MERRRPFYICVIGLAGICRAIALGKAGGGVEAFFEYSEDVGKIRVKADDLASCSRYYLHLVKTNDKKIFRWLDEYKVKTDKARQLIKKYSGKNDFEYSDADRVFSFFEDYFFVSTALPFFLLSGINLHLESGGKTGDFKKIIGLYNRLRIKESVIDPATFRFIVRAAEIIGCDKSLASYLTPDEIRQVFKNHFFNVGLLKKRKKFCKVFYKTGRPPRVEYRKSGISRVGFSGIKKLANRLSGKCAYGGIARGKAAIMNSPEDAQRFKRGGVIVSVNANPRIAPFIKKASALVTDEGGIMCHATIFAREFRKPCVTGTKIATKIFRNGDFLEVDADRGTVKKLR